MKPCTSSARLACVERESVVLFHAATCIFICTQLPALIGAVTCGDTYSATVGPARHENTESQQAHVMLPQIRKGLAGMNWHACAQVPLSLTQCHAKMAGLRLSSADGND